MSDNQTTNVGLYVPARGSDSGTWDQPVNANASVVDSLVSNVATISTTGGSVPALTAPPNSGAAWSGPYQTQSSLIVVSGALSSNAVITIPRPGYFIFQNSCTNTSTHYVQLTNGTGNTIGLPPGKKCHVFNDGTNMDYVNMPDVGTAYDLHGVTTLPPWMLACTIAPYLIKDGTIYNNTAYPALAAQLGTTFGGSLGTTFAVPDERARARIAFDPGSTGRLTTAVSGVNGATMGSVGGDQNLATHTHIATVTDPGHHHSYSAPGGGGGTYQNAVGIGTANFTTGTSQTGITVANASSGSGVGANVQPSIVSFLPLVKT